MDPKLPEINWDWQSWTYAWMLPEECDFTRHNLYASVNTVAAQYRVYVFTDRAERTRCLVAIADIGLMSPTRALDVSHLPVHDVALAVALRAHAEVMGEINNEPIA